MPIAIRPEFAPFEVPELNVSRPLSPLLPALPENTNTAPLLRAVLCAANMLTSPPDCDGVRPAVRDTQPPNPLVPLPTQSVPWPPRPCVAELEPRWIEPPLPLDEVPVLNTIHPEQPATPLFADLKKRYPLVVLPPRPESAVSRPPEHAVALPANNPRTPAAELSPLPTLNPIDAPQPDVAVPVPM